MTTLSSLSLSFFDGVSLTARGSKAFSMTRYSLQEQWRKRSFLKLKPNLMDKYLLQKLLGGIDDYCDFAKIVKGGFRVSGCPVAKLVLFRFYEERL